MSDDGEFSDYSDSTSEEEVRDISSPMKRNIFGPVVTPPMAPAQRKRPPEAEIVALQTKNEKITLKKHQKLLRVHGLRKRNCAKSLRSWYLLLSTYKKPPRDEAEEPVEQPITSENTPNPEEEEETVEETEKDGDDIKEAPVPATVKEEQAHSPPAGETSPSHGAAQVPVEQARSATPGTPSTPSTSHRPPSPGGSSSSSSCAPIRRPDTGFAELLVNPKASEQTTTQHPDDALVRVVYSVPVSSGHRISQGAPVLSFRRKRRPVWEDLGPGQKMPEYDASKDPHCKQLFKRPLQQKLMAKAEKGSADSAQQRRLSAGAKLAWRFVVNNTYGKKTSKSPSTTPPPPTPATKAVVGVRMMLPSGKRTRSCCVVAVKSEAVKIHYEGHSDAYDEWVRYDNVRFKKATVVGSGQKIYHPSHIPAGVLVDGNKEFVTSVKSSLSSRSSPASSVRSREALDTAERPLDAIAEASRMPSFSGSEGEDEETDKSSASSCDEGRPSDEEPKEEAKPEDPQSTPPESNAGSDSDSYEDDFV